MNNKVAALTVAFNEPRLLPSVVRQFKQPYCRENVFHMVLISEKPWHGNCEYDEGKTFQAALGAEYIEVSDWLNQAEQFNYGLKKLQEYGYDWAIICDADEFYTDFGLRCLLEDIELNPHISQFRTQFIEVYWKLPLFRISNRQHDNPVIAIRTDQFFFDKRTPTLSEYSFSSAGLHHFSYVRSNEEMLKKIQSFEHSDEFDTEKWYNNVWKKWVPSMKNLHPVVPSQFEMAIKKTAPKEIIKNFYKGKEVTWSLD